LAKASFYNHHQTMVVAMKASRKTLIIIAALTATPLLANAASLSEDDYSATKASLNDAPMARSLAQMNLEPRFYLKRPYASDASIEPASDRPATAFSRQVAADGPVGSVGLISLSDRGVVQDHTFGDSLASQRGLPSRALGFKVSYNFP